MIREAPYYWVVCDSCGVNAQDGSEHSAWAEAGSAIDEAIDSEWTEDGRGKHHCPACPPFCSECCGDAGADAAERDYMCRPCWLRSSPTNEVLAP